jgi:hypothetical protein
MTRIIASLLALFTLASPAFAHKASDAYLSIDQHGAAIEARLDLALRDLDLVVDLDRDGDGSITWGELRSRHGEVAAYALSRLRIDAGGERCVLAVDGHEVERHSDGVYAVLRLAGACPRASPVLAIDYRMLFEVDATHRGLLRFAADDGSARTSVLTSDRPTLAISASTGLVEQAGAYLVQGALHIFGGFDHLLFLVSLLLPAVLVRDADSWTPVASFRHALTDVAKVVTAFTLAHSITLSLAVLDLVSLPSRWVESAIALSVILAALNNLRPLVRNARAAFAFGFGLVHGFGFAGALGELGLPDDALALSLVSFNVGVELGQLLIVAGFLPLAFLLRGTPAYQRIGVAGGSLAIAGAGFVWLAERAL